MLEDLFILVSKRPVADLEMEWRVRGLEYGCGSVSCYSTIVLLPIGRDILRCTARFLPFSEPCFGSFMDNHFKLPVSLVVTPCSLLYRASFTIRDRSSFSLAAEVDSSIMLDSAKYLGQAVYFLESHRKRLL